MDRSGKGSHAPIGPHRRYNQLADEWVLVSAERLRRPWLGVQESSKPVELPDCDPECYLCPGNMRAGGAQNPEYETTFVFTNDFAALVPDSPIESFQEGLLRAESEPGTCRVVCFSPRHNLSLGNMSPDQVRTVVDLWATQSTELGELYPWVQVFENRGAAMGGSNPHPHGQIWAGNGLPTQAAREDASQRRYRTETGRSMLVDYAEQEVGGPRQVDLDDDWLVVAPFWGAWPYETMVIPRRPAARLADLDNSRRDSLAKRLIGLIKRYDNLFGVSLPYSMGWHQAPYGHESPDHWQLHAHFFPPLIQATTRKFMVGYELLSEPQRDITAESAAERLRASISSVAARPGSQS